MHIIDGRLDIAHWCPSPNFGPRPPGNEGEVNLVVIHNISLPPGQFGGGYVQRFFQNALPVDEHPYFTEIAALQVSSHLLIERDGAVTQFVNFNDRAWHAGRSVYNGREDCNDYSVGIELEGTDSEAYSAVQYATLIAVIRALQQAYPAIGMRITGHEHIAPGRKTDPGPAFDWQHLLRLLASSGD